MEDRDLPTLLLVDDTVAQLDLYELALESRYHVLRAHRADEALVLAAAERPDVIVSDVLLPGDDGIALCRQLKRRHETEMIPVLLLTAYPSATIEKHGRDAGAVALLGKPCPADRLIAAIEQVLTHSETADSSR